jgi:MFS family permease
MAKLKTIAAIMDDLDSPEEPGRRLPQRRHRLMPEPFPDFAKSLVTQNKASPLASGAAQGLTYGALGSILGALTGRLTDQDNNRTALLALLGGMLGGGTGFYSGKRQRESNNSRLFFLRRMGVDNPGALEAVAQYPTLARKLTEKAGPEEEVKAAQMGMGAGEVAGRALAGALAGGVIGRNVTPRIMGYKDDPSAVNMSTLLDASLGAFGGAGLPHVPGWLRDPSMAAKLMGGVGAAELMPVGANMLHRGTKAMEDLKIPPSVSEQVRDVLNTPEARGVGAGAATAGIAAILTGLLRAKTKHESEAEAGRDGMVTKDFLKYLIPAMLAGGVAGNVARNS